VYGVRCLRWNTGRWENTKCTFGLSFATLEAGKMNGKESHMSEFRSVREEERKGDEKYKDKARSKSTRKVKK
jgi:hypothetical protein